MKSFLQFFIEESDPEKWAVSLNSKWKEKYGTCSMSGNCGKIAGMLRKKMEAAGHSGELVSGEFHQGGKNHGNHGWIQWKDKILDPSVHQYGPEHPVVTTINDPKYKKHRSMIFSSKKE